MVECRSHLRRTPPTTALNGAEGPKPRDAPGVDRAVEPGQRRVPVLTDQAGEPARNSPSSLRWSSTSSADVRVGPRGPARGAAGAGPGAARSLALKPAAVGAARRRARRAGAFRCRPIDSARWAMVRLEEHARIEHRVAPVAEHLEADGADDRRPGLEASTTFSTGMLGEQARRSPGPPPRQLLGHRAAAAPGPSRPAALRLHHAGGPGRPPRGRTARPCPPAPGSPGPGVPKISPHSWGCAQRPAPRRARGTASQRSASPAAPAGPSRSARLGRPLGLVGQRLVGTEDEGAQQGIAPVEVAVQRGGGHPQVPGDGAQGERGGAVAGQVLPGPRPGSPPSSPRGPAPGPCGADGRRALAGAGHGASLPALIENTST